MLYLSANDMLAFGLDLAVRRSRQGAREKALYYATERYVGIQSISHVVYEGSAKTNGREQECVNSDTGVKLRETSYSECIYIVDTFNLCSLSLLCIQLFWRYTSFWPS